MLNYIKAELYRNFNRAQLWVYSGIIAGVVLLMNILITGSPITDFNIILSMVIQVLNVPIFLVAAMIDMSAGEEQKFLTLKNVVAFGVPRSKIALSKVIVAVILSLIAAVIILGTFLGSGILLFGIKTGTSAALGNLLLRVLAALPLWTGAIAVGILIALVFNNNTMGAFVYAGTFLIISGAIRVLSYFVWDKFTYIYNILITTQLRNLSKPELGSHTLITAAGIGIAYTILFTLISMVYIRRKEIK